MNDERTTGGDPDDGDRLREKISSRGEEGVGDAVQTLLDSPVLKQALHAAFGARDLATSATGQAMKTLNVASADEHARLARRLRAVSDRLEAVEDQLDRLSRELSELRRQGAPREAAEPRVEEGAAVGQERLGLSE